MDLYRELRTFIGGLNAFIDSEGTFIVPEGTFIGVQEAFVMPQETFIGMQEAFVVSEGRYIGMLETFVGVAEAIIVPDEGPCRIPGAQDRSRQGLYRWEGKHRGHS